MKEIIYETKPYCEFKMMEAIQEYDQEQGLSAFAIATKYDLPVQDLHQEYAKYRAQGYRHETI